MKRILLLAAFNLTVSLLANAQIHRVAEMNTVQIEKLNRERTVVLLPGGILEQHGPLLPSFTDGYWNEHVTEKLARAIAARRGWNVLIFPTIPLGNSGANEVGGKFSYPGTYAVRFETLRAVYMDLAAELGEQGFKWVFVINIHGAPNHQRALDQASDYFTDIYGGKMTNLTGLMSVFELLDGDKTPAERKEDGFVLHSGMDETSMMLAIRPDLVSPAYKSAKPIASDRFEDLILLAQRPEWLGYFGSPRLASAKKYRSGWGRAETELISTALKILDGKAPKVPERMADVLSADPAEQQLSKHSLEHESTLKAKQDAWLRNAKK